MKNLAAIAIAVALASSPFMALAQDASTTTTTSSTNAMATGSVGNYGSLISSLNAGKMADVKAFTAASTVNCVKVSTLKVEASANAKALDNALTKSATQVSDLKTAINANADLKAKLDAATCPIDDIVSVTTEVDGSFTVYVDDRA